MTQSASHKPVYLVYGQADDKGAPRRDAKFQSDAYLKREAVARISRAVLGDDDARDGATRFTGKEAALADVLDEVRTYSLLGDTRLVIVEDADSFITRHRKGLEKYCAAPSDTGVLVLVCKTSNSKTKLHVAIQALGGVVACQTPRGKQLTDWIARQARDRYGKRMERSAVAALHESCDDSLGRLDAELAKLATYVGDRAQITADDVQALVGRNREQRVFAVTDAMAAGNPVAALKAWEQVLATDPLAEKWALGGLAWGIRRRVGSISFPQLAAQLTDLLQIDLDSKTGLGDVNRGVEKFVVRHSRRAAAG